MGFSVYLQSGKKKYKIKDMNENDKISVMISKLKEKIKSTELILCIFESVPLEPSNTLQFYGIKRHSIIQYSEKYKGGSL